MNEITGNILDYIKLDDPKIAVCITTNGCITKAGVNVMGAGIAKAFKEQFPELPSTIANSIKRFGNVPSLVYSYDNKTNILTLPTKHGKIKVNDIDCVIPRFRENINLNYPVQGWMLLSSYSLIEQSLIKLVKLVNRFGYKECYLPRPGCSNGGLNWEKDIKPLCELHLDERFYIVTLPKKNYN